MNKVIEGHSHELGRFITLPEERLLIAQRKHWFTLAVPLFFQGWFLLILVTFSFALFVFFLKQSALFILSIAILLPFFLTSITKTILDWYFHFYVITNRKILEIACSPLFSHTVNEILLDQVRCTEIDIKRDGILNHILDKGHVIVTFDRPTHQEEFLFTDISDPHTIGTYLADIFDQMRSVSEGRWFRSHNGITYFVDETSSNEEKRGGDTNGIIYPRTL